MSQCIVLVRVRFTEGGVVDLDALARDCAQELGRAVSRAAILRALTKASLQDADQRLSIVAQLGADTVRRGPPQGEKRAVVVGVRFAESEIAKIDALARDCANEVKRAVSRAALLRALTRTSLQGSDRRPAIVKLVRDDSLRHGAALLRPRAA